jgi:hypothetical protein
MNRLPVLLSSSELVWYFALAASVWAALEYRRLRRAVERLLNRSK